MKNDDWVVLNPEGRYRIIVTLPIPGGRWKKVFTDAGCRTEIHITNDPLSPDDIKPVIGDRCDGVLGLLSERWDDNLFSSLAHAGGKVYCNYAVGINNIDITAASRHKIAVGNTPGVLTEATAEIAVALTLAAARRIVEGDSLVRGGRFSGWLPDLLLGELLWRRTLGIVGAGRIGTSYARMMVEGHKMNLVYFSNHQNASFELFLTRYAEFLASQGETPIRWKRTPTIEELLRESDCVALHVPLTPATRHLIDAQRLAIMKENAILVNTSRGPVIDEKALVEHCRRHPQFRAGLDVYENEPALTPGLEALPNVVLAPHLGSGTSGTRENMGVLAARNITGILNGYPVWNHSDITPMVGDASPKATPHIVNAHELGLPLYKE